ncbi:hypothetical protein ACM664_02865 [Enterococcus faecalis]|uniref:hypothetical protein n=1 Tax=Enterococcus faecalis TaxID=1351 RepID=UPI00115A1AEA|nr:hypothetical protein [Enterococcus faecalis]HAP3003021.1 hypothetical protein [Enterococcus faecalis]HAP3032560.1 hypothetical protein [Enterococcus faecalis]HAP5998906.1 hypothetical protein [Enterococcus faecalis]
MQLNIPDEVIQNELADNITCIVLKEIEKRLNLLTNTIELPPYPNKSQVKKILEIGDEKLSSWISKGLKVQQWSGQDIRIERSELQRFLKETFEI